jgi:hypothetical protein
MMHGGDTPVRRRVFISYRREDSEGHAGRLYDALAARFGAERVFMDVDAVPLGVDFAEAIDEAVSSCDVLLAVIGRQWLTITDDHGNRRLEDPRDFVRLEIKAALDRDVRVIPVFVGGADVPPSDQLPPVVAGLSQRNGIALRADSWRHGVERLVAAIEQAGRSAFTEIDIDRDWKTKILPTVEKGSESMARLLGEFASPLGFSDDAQALRVSFDRVRWNLVLTSEAPELKEASRSRVVEYREQLLDLLVENDERLMERYLEGEDFTEAEIGVVSRALIAHELAAALQEIYERRVEVILEDKA